MKEYPELWERLKFDETKLSTIKRDWTEGKAPDLPFVIIDQKEVKDHIRKKLESINGSRMETTVLQANYGNGKTNFFKYLELYFENHPESNIKFISCKANQDQTDLCMFLMQYLQNSCMNDLKTQIKALSAEPAIIRSLAGEFKNDFALIEGYTNALFDQNNADNLDSLIYLGTGRLYSKGMFDKFKLQKLSDFNRREVFVLFMNILSTAGIYLVFAIDELEKIFDKSSKRMARYFSSYRELMDLFNKIHGHYLMTAITNGISIQIHCPPLYERLGNDIIELDTIKDDADIKDLVILISELLDKNLDDNMITDIAGRTKKKKDLDNNRKKIQFISEQIKSLETQNDVLKKVSLEEALSKSPDLLDLYNKTKKELYEQDSLSNLSRAFFDPLDYYLTALGYKMNRNYRRDYQAVVDDDMHKAFFFLFNDDTKIKERIEDFSEKKDIHDFVVFATDKMDVNYSQLQHSNDRIRIVEYDPEQLFVLLNMYRWNFDKQKEISKLLNIATINVF